MSVEVIIMPNELPRSRASRNSFDEIVQVNCNPSVTGRSPLFSYVLVLHAEKTYCANPSARVSPLPPTASLQWALYLAGIFTGFSLLRSAMHGCEKGGFSYSPKTEGLHAHCVFY